MVTDAPPYTYEITWLKKYCLAVGLGAGLMVLVLGLFPAADIAVSSWFYTSPHHFVDTPLLHFLHSAGPYIVLAVGAIALALLFRAKRIGIKEVVYAISGFLLGPGLIINALLKEYYGRARPVHIEAFGGQAHFTSVITPAHECLHNCSFSAGDPSVGFMLVVFAFILPQQAKRLAAASLAAGLAFGGLRVIQGGHFLSDVAASALICTLSALLLHAAFYGRRGAAYFSFTAARKTLS